MQSVIRDETNIEIREEGFDQTKYIQGFFNPLNPGKFKAKIFNNNFINIY